MGKGQDCDSHGPDVACGSKDFREAWFVTSLATKRATTCYATKKAKKARVHAGDHGKDHQVDDSAMDPETQALLNGFTAGVRTDLNIAFDRAFSRAAPCLCQSLGFGAQS